MCLDQLISLSLKVGGVRAGKGGTMHLDLPVFNTVEEAMKAVQVQHAVLLLFFFSEQYFSWAKFMARPLCCHVVSVVNI